MNNNRLTFAKNNAGRLHNATVQYGVNYAHVWQYLLEDRGYVAL